MQQYSIWEGDTFHHAGNDSCFESPKNFGVYLRDGQNHEVGVVDGITQPDCKALEGFLYLLVSHSGIA